MVKTRRAFVLSGLTSAGMLAAPFAGRAAVWPQRPVKFIVPFGPGAGADIGARVFAERLQALWAKPVVVENRPGGDSIVAITAFLNANDDHTFLFAPAGNFAVKTDAPYAMMQSQLQAGRIRAGRKQRHPGAGGTGCADGARSRLSFARSGRPDRPFRH